jgi:hypothetical protein
MSGSAPLNELPKDPGNITNLLLESSSGDSSALDQLIPIIYDDLLRLVRVRLKSGSALPTDSQSARTTRRDGSSCKAAEFQ